jgi:CDP-diacylglycerol--glycerol-3-phosphate 3-phosphatidyltransferase
LPLNAPNLLTLLRLALIPLLVLTYYWHDPWRPAMLLAIFAGAGFTDWLDGYLARKLGQTSPFGAFMDPVADKLIVVISLLLLVADARIANAMYDSRLFTVVVIIIVGREIAISALREWMAQMGQRSSVKVSFIGKWKTGIQMVAIGALLYAQPLLGLPTLLIGEVLLYVAAVLTLWSMVVYLIAAWPVLTSTPDKNP